MAATRRLHFRLVMSAMGNGWGAHLLATVSPLTGGALGISRKMHTCIRTLSVLRAWKSGHSFPQRTFAVLSARKPPTGYVCSSCGDSFPKWSGKCASCNEYNTISEFRASLGGASAAAQHNVSPSAVQRSWLGASSGTVLRLAPLASFSSASAEAWSLGSVELDRLLGGRGLTLGSSTLFSGSPGVGKSTLLLQLAGLLSGARRAAGGAGAGAPYAAFFRGSGAAPEGASASAAGSSDTPLRTVVYISGEESAAQLKGRAERLRLDAPNLLVLNETKLEDVLAQLSAAYEHTQRTAPPAARLSAVIVDSIQTLWTEGLPSHAGTVAQVKECAVKLTAWAKATGVPVIMVGHVNKAGDIAGPRVLEHIVDCVLYMEGAEESAGEASGGGGGAAPGAPGAPSHGHRVVRALKNRYGSTSEVGLFQMCEEGFVEAQPARLFLSGEGDARAAAAAVGCAVAVAAEGSRPLCVEVQALVQRAAGAYPRARACGVSLDRLHLLTAVLSRHTSLAHAGFLGGADVIVNVVGGLRLSDPSSELALALALASSTAGAPLPRGTVFLGEVGLTGEVRGAVPRLRERLAAARALGFSRAFVPRSALAGAAAAQLGGLAVVPAASLREVVEQCLPGAGVRRGGGGGARGGGGQPQPWFRRAGGEAEGEEGGGGGR